MSAFYNLFSGPEQRLVRDAVELLKPMANDRLIDVGCGTGSAIRYLRKRAGSSPNIYGIDLSLEMCRQTARRSHSMNAREKALISNANALQLPFRAGSFNQALLSFTMEIFPPAEIHDLLAEITRVLVPGGRLCAVGIADSNSRHLIYRLYRWSHKRFPSVIDCRPIKAAEYIEQAGLRIIQSENYSLWGIPVSIVLAELIKKE